MKTNDGENQKRIFIIDVSRSADRHVRVHVQRLGRISYTLGIAFSVHSILCLGH